MTRCIDIETKEYCKWDDWVKIRNANPSGQENEVTVTTTQCFELYSSYELVFQNYIFMYEDNEKYTALVGAYIYVYRHHMRFLHAT
jgi:flagellum-specific peptidoglycan hydrolase FlgJ